MNEPEKLTPPRGEEPAAAPAPSGAQRALDGLRGLGARCLLACLVATLPGLLLPWWLSGLAERVSAAHAGLGVGLQDHARHAEAREAELERARGQVAAQAVELGRARHELEARRALDALAARLAALARDRKTPDEMVIAPEVAAALAPAADNLAEVVLIDTDIEEALCARSGTPRGLLTERLPDLAAVWSRERAPAAWTVPGWHWLRVGGSRYTLAARLAEPPPPPSPPRAPATPALPAFDPTALRAADAELGRAAWTLGLAIPLGGLLLGLAAAWWLSVLLVRPLRRLGEAARAVWATPGEAQVPGPDEAGLFQDLAGHLARLAERMQRLAALEAESSQLGEQARSLVASLEHAAQGRLGLHAPAVPGALAEVVVALNRMLDSTAERLTGVERAAGHLRTSAEHLQQTAEGLGQALEPEERPPAPGVLAELVGVQVDGLCAQIARLLELGVGTDGGQLGPEERQALSGHLQAVRTGFRMVGERIAEVLAERVRVDALREAAQTLATNLAIAAEAQSRTQLERLGEDARHLAREAVDMAEGFGDALGLLERLGVQLQERFEAAAALLQQQVQEAAALGERRASARRLAEELAPRLPDIRASVAGLGHDLRAVAQAWEHAQARRERVTAGIAKLTRAAAAQAEAAEALLEVVGRFDTGGPTPAAVTQRLAAQQHQLRAALDELATAAAGAGVQVLTAEARAILESIQAMADEARERLGEPTLPAPVPPPPPVAV